MATKDPVFITDMGIYPGRFSECPLTGVYTPRICLINPVYSSSHRNA